MIRKSGNRLSLGTNAKRLPGDHTQTKRSSAGTSAVGDLPYPGAAGGMGDVRAAAIIHHCIETIAFLLEVRHQRPVERAPARQFDAHRIDEAAVDQDLVVDVGAGRLSGGADEADHLALPHPLAGLHALGEVRNVAVGSLLTILVLDADVFAVAAFPLGFLDDAVAGGENRRAVGRARVDAVIHLVVAEDRMAADAESRAHDRGVDRLSHPNLLYALPALLAIVDPPVVRGLEAIG